MTKDLTTHDDFPAKFKGPTLSPGDDGYNDARQIWNMRRGDESPSLIAQVLDADDIVVAVNYARDKDLTIAVRSGGHGIDGSAMPDGALVVDTSKMKGISIDTKTGQADLESGVLLREMDVALMEHGLVVPAGVVSDTGVAGLTLGGGVGHNTRRLGATVDNLISVEAVTMDGRKLTVSEDSEPELFWGLRGAGHNLAIVTSFKFQAHKIGPEVISGLRFYTQEEAVKLCAGMDEAMSTAPRELSVPLVFAPAPPLTGLPPESVGQPILISVIVYTGPKDKFDAAMSDIDALAKPLANMVGPVPWSVTNSMLDTFQPAGRRFHSAGAYVPEMSAELAELAIERCAAAPPATPTASGLVGFPMLGGAIFDVDEDACALSRIGANWISEIQAMWDSEEADDEYVGWINDTLKALEPYSPGTGYINLTADQGPEWLTKVYGSPEKWERIVALKREWDPDNRLAHNKNVLRAVEAGSA